MFVSGVVIIDTQPTIPKGNQWGAAEHIRMAIWWLSGEQRVPVNSIYASDHLQRAIEILAK